MKTMKNTFRKGIALFALVAAFAIIFVGCSKDSSSSNGGGSGPTPPSGDYGTFTIGSDSYTITYAGYDCYYDDDEEDYIFTIGFADRVVDDDDNANAFAISFLGRETIPTGTFNYVTTEPSSTSPEGFLITEDQHAYYCKDGSVTITKNGSKYTVTSNANVCDFMGQNDNTFKLNYSGPLTQFEDYK